MQNAFFIKLSRWYNGSTFRHWSAFVVISLIAIAFILLSRIIPEATVSIDPVSKERIEHELIWHHLFRDIGIALFPIGIMALVYEYILRDHFLETMQKKIETTIEEKMPPRYKHMRDSGLVDIYPNLRIDKMKDDIEAISNCEIRIMDIWMENFFQIENALVKAILNRKCRVRILLWDPRQTDVLERRAKALGNGATVRVIIEKIMTNLLSLVNILRKITEEPETENKGAFEVKLYTSFIAVSFLGYGDVCYIGSFLRERVSSMGTQLKVTGHHHFFYKELDRHFESQWNDQVNNFNFTPELYEELKLWVDNYIAENRKN